LNRKKKRIVLFLLPVIWFFSCASETAARKKQTPVFLTNNSAYVLLLPKDIEKPMDNYHLISTAYRGQTYVINAWVKADRAGMEMTLINEFGANIGELSYRNGIASLSSAVLPQTIQPEYIVADFQLCFYNARALHKALENCGLSFEETRTGRRIFEGKKVIIEIIKGPHTVRLVNHVRGYAYTLEGAFE